MPSVALASSRATVPPASQGRLYLEGPSSDTSLVNELTKRIEAMEMERALDKDISKCREKEEKEKPRIQGMFRANVKNVHAVETSKCGMCVDVGHTTDTCPIHTIVNDMQVEPQDCNWVAKTQGNAG